MSLSITEDFTRDGFDLISCQNPLVLKAELGNSDSSASSGDVEVSIRGQGDADNTNLYQFGMAYVETTGSSPNYTHHFKLNITDVIRNISNEPSLENKVASLYIDDCRLATYIAIQVDSTGETAVLIYGWFMHGFNQVNNPDSSCLVDFADVSEDAIISIVPGAPQLFYLWMATTSTGEVGYYVVVTKNGTVVDSAIMSDPVSKGLYQFYSMTDLGSSIYGAFDLPNTLYKLQIRTDPGDPDSVLASCDMIAFKQACDGDVVLTWLNRYGIYSSMAFTRFPTYKGEQTHIGSYDIDIDDLADVQSRKKSRGYDNVKTIISAVAKSIPTQYFEAIEDLFYSMDVYMYVGSTLPDYSFGSTGVEWMRVTVRGNLTERRKRKFEDVRVDISLPEKYTQIR
jgi:hypothetical protein